MEKFPIDEIDIPAWVAKEIPEKRAFREAVHIILFAISSSLVLRSTMIMKGGMLMAIRYNSSRYTKDADFSTRDKYFRGNEDELLVELDSQIAIANEVFSYDTMCLRQRTKLNPNGEESSFPTLQLGIGYASKSKESARRKLLNKQSPHVVAIDFSYNEAVYDVEVIELGDGDALKVYSYINLVAEKIRSLLQQPVRRRERQQDVYDLNLLIQGTAPLKHDEKKQLLKLIIESCKERQIDAKRESIAHTEVKKLARKGYENLASDINGPLPPFDEAYAMVQEFYEQLPW